MPNLLIAPVGSKTNKLARRHWADTLERSVHFAANPHLTEPQRAVLRRFHPDGHAHFWGAVPAHDNRFTPTKADAARVQPGDVVLFTGDKHIQGIGEIGATFRNAAFADSLWAHGVGDPLSWHNVYSLRSLVPVHIPYAELQGPLEVSPNDNFMGLRLIPEQDPRVDRVLDALGIATFTTAERDTSQAHQTIATLTTKPSTLTSPESMNVAESSYQQAARSITIRRAEAVLVADFTASLDPGLRASGLNTAAGPVDRYLSTGPDHGHLIEAKAGPDHRYVRQALGQLLDYIDAIDNHPVTEASALLPERPADRDIKLLHRYGLGVIHRSEDGTYRHLPAPEAATAFWRTPTKAQQPELAALTASPTDILNRPGTATVQHPPAHLNQHSPRER